MKNRVQQWVAMLTMLCDHISGFTHPFLSILGNMSMPMYSYMIASSHGQVLQWALIAELPYMLWKGEPFNVVWLFWMARAFESKGYDPLVEKAEGVMAVVVGSFLFGIKPSWILWLCLCKTTRREIWYGVTVPLAILVGWPWLVHLAGYEVARWGYGKGPRVNGQVWRWFYPVHLAGLGVLTRFVL